MKINKNHKIKDLITFEPDIYHDFRGENVEIFSEKVYKEFTSSEFVIDSLSRSTKNVLRGFHGDEHAWKLIQVLYGCAYCVIIDMRPNSSTRNYTETFNLNDKNRLQVLIPAGCVNAHLCISDECLFSYKLTYGYVEPTKQIHVKWNDPTYEIYWPIKTPILSQRDNA